MTSAVARDANYDRTYGVTVTFNGKNIFHGRLEVWNSWTPARRVYKGTDAFQNICINKSYTIYSSHHRLYCTVPESQSSTQELEPSK